MLHLGKHKRWLLGASLLVPSLVGYGRRAYAACTPGTPGNYLCSGVTAPQAFNLSGAVSFNLDPTLSITHGAGNGFQVQADDILFNTQLGSTIVSSTSYVNSSVYLLSSGAINATVNGYINNSGSTGFVARSNYGDGIIFNQGADSAIFGGVGAVLVNTFAVSNSTSTITLAGDIGINTAIEDAVIIDDDNPNNHNITLTTTSSSDITIGGNTNIWALQVRRNAPGSGDLTVNLSGDIVSGRQAARLLHGYNHQGDINATVGGTIQGGVGIFNLGGGNIDVNLTGQVTSLDNNVPALSIAAGGGGGSGDITLTTAAGSMVTGNRGIAVTSQYSYGMDQVDVTLAGTIYTSINAFRLEATSQGINFTLAETGLVQSGNTALIISENAAYGGSINATLNGDIVGGSIFYQLGSSTNPFTLTQGVNSQLNNTNGIGLEARVNNSTATINLSGEISSTANGLYLRNVHSSGNTNITIHNTADISSSGGIAASVRGHNTTSLQVDGTLTGSSRGLSLTPRGNSTTTISNSATISGDTALRLYTSTNYLTHNITLSGDLLGTSSALDLYAQYASDSVININITPTAQLTGSQAVRINYQAYNPAYYLGYNGPQFNINIAGGQVDGDIIDFQRYYNTSTVNITGDFTTNGDISVSNINIDTGHTLTLSDQDSLNTSSTGAVNIYGTLLMQGDSGNSANMIIHNNGTLTLDDLANRNLDNLTNNGTLELRQGSYFQVNNLYAGVGLIRLGFTTAANTPLLRGSNLDFTGQTFEVDLGASPTLVNGQELIVVDASYPITGGPGGTPLTITDNSALWNFSLVDGTAIGTPTDNTDLFLQVAAATTVSNLANNQNNLSVGEVLDALNSTPPTDTNLLNVISAFNAAPDSAAFNNVLASTLPNINSGTAQQLISVTDGILAMTSQRLAGIAAGDAPTASQELWLQAIGQTTRQDSTAQAPGYSSSTRGLMIGAETDYFGPDTLVGLAFAKGATEARGKDINRSNTEVDSLQATLYARHELSATHWLEASGSMAWHNISTRRSDVGGVPGLTANGKFDAYQVALQTKVGQDIPTDWGMITPEVGLTWQRYVADDYQETDAGGAGLSVSDTSANNLTLGTGLTVSLPYKDLDGTLYDTRFRAGYNYALQADEITTRSRFIGGGSSFTTAGLTPERHGFNLGTEFSAFNTDDESFSLRYDFDFRQGFTQHTALISFRKLF